MQLTWFGTAGFQIDAARHTVLIDPYFTRNPKAVPRQKLQTSDIKKADLIFISHGHFDHVFDVATIASQTGARVYCGKGIDTTLMQKAASRRSTLRLNSGTGGKMRSRPSASRVHADCFCFIC
jgi:L-ascorbate metabolism protein UlaG (beta-lactamase superfamily)